MIRAEVIYMSKRIKVVGVTMVLAMLWILLKVVLGVEWLASILESMGFVLGLRWVAIWLVERYFHKEELEIHMEITEEDLP
jgi:hypothetical protein